jgi:hypothetical protein
MSDINVNFYIDGIDKNEQVISYERSQDICSSVGKLDVVFAHTVTGFVDLDPYDEIILYEDGIKKGIYYVLEIHQEASTGNYTLTCQDKSKRLQDYWITSQYSVKSRITTRYWLEKFLTDAGIDFSFDLEDPDDWGAYVNNDTVFGPSSAYDLIIQLLQMSSWYLYFDPDGTAIIGKFINETDNYTLALNDQDIIELRTTKHDKMLRNRVVVWGKADPYNRGWVFADVYKPTPYDYDSSDKRTLVVANSYIENVTAAYSLAGKAIKEFTKLNFEKEVIVTGHRNVSIGDVVLIDSEYYSGSGMVTSLGSKMDASGGLTTHIILDQRCPRIYAYYSFGNPVYIGTTEDGVWKKPLKFHTWSDYNTGLPLTDRHIVDLAANAGTLVCVTSLGNAYMRTPLTTGWRKITIVDYTCFDPDDHSYTADELTAVCCDINKATCDVYVGYKGQPDTTNFPDRWQSFIITATSSTKYTTSLIKDSLNNRFYLIYDLTSNEKELIISAYGEITSKAVMLTCLTTTGAYPQIGNVFISSEQTHSMPEQGTLSADLIISSGASVGNIPSDGEYVYYYFTAGSRYYAVKRKISDNSYTSIDFTDTVVPYTRSLVLDNNGRLLLFGRLASDTSYYGFAAIDFDAQTAILLGAEYTLADIFAGYEDPTGWTLQPSMSPIVIPTKNDEYVALMYNTYTIMGFFIDAETTATSFAPVLIASKFKSFLTSTGQVYFIFTVNPVVDRNKLIISFSRRGNYVGSGG